MPASGKLHRARGTGAELQFVWWLVDPDKRYSSRKYGASVTAMTQREPVANHARLVALGKQINRDSLPDTPSRPKHGRRDTGRSLWRIAGLIAATALVLVVGVIGAGYAYLHYEFNRIHRVKCPSCISAA